MRFKFHIFKIHFAAVLLSAILSGAFSLAFVKLNTHSAAQTVYCPLTKKLQPVNPPGVSATYLLNEICAADSQKIRLALAISANLKLKFTNLNRHNFENLAFDFWQKGKAAFDSLPNTPNLPEKFLVKNFFSITGFSSHYEIKSVWKTSENFTFQMQARPPTKLDFPEFSFEITRKLDRISRRIAPRAPPVVV